ncbi:MAG: glycoside hydrolase family 16 protein [Rikenellaceae bacterium]
MKRMIFASLLISMVSVGYCGGSEEKLVWCDEFDGTEVNRADWTFELGASGWGNDELQEYTDGDNAKVKDGYLTITARKIGEEGAQERGGYTSTRIMTKDKKEFLYGRIEARMKMPKGVGGWAAFWMLGASFPDSVNWPLCGEIDIMEYVGFTPNIHNMAMHNGSSSGFTVNKDTVEVANAEEEFHVYGIDWSEESIKFYVDSPENVAYEYRPAEYNEDTWPHNKPHFLILNLAVGGGWGGSHGVDDTAFPMEFVIDYVRVYQ